MFRNRVDWAEERTPEAASVAPKAVPMRKPESSSGPGKASDALAAGANFIRPSLSDCTPLKPARAFMRLSKLIKIAYTLNTTYYVLYILYTIYSVPDSDLSPRNLVLGYAECGRVFSFRRA